MKLTVSEQLAANREAYRLGLQLQLGQTRELIERTHAQDLVHAAERKRWLEHVNKLHEHLYRLIDEKREWELEQRAFELESLKPGPVTFVKSDYWKEALAFYQPTRN